MINFGEKFESKKVLQLLQRSVPYYLKSWKPIDKDTGLFGNTSPHFFNMKEVALSSPVIEYVIRPHLNILCVLCSYLNKNESEMLKDVINEDELLSKVQKGLVWLSQTHITGSMNIDTFLERKRWGENWQSGLWAGLMGICMHLIFNRLDITVRDKIKRVIVFEADRFIDVLPPSGFDYDTKIEENSQDVVVLAWALQLFPDHPHVAQWSKAFHVWALNCATALSLKADHSEFLGKSIAHWTVTQTLFPDYTAEHHGFFNPEILGYSMWIILASMAFISHQKPIPSILQQKIHQQTFDVLVRFCLPNGHIYSPSGRDLPYFFPHPLLLVWGLWYKDPRSQRMTSCLLNWMDQIQAATKDNHVPWIKGFNAHYEGWELLMQSQVGFELAMLSVIPFPEDPRFYSIGQIEKSMETLQNYPFVQVCYNRNTFSTRSISWKTLGKHPLIGLTMHVDPELLLPYTANLLGIPKVDSKLKNWEVAHHIDMTKPKGFDSYGTINYYDHANMLLMHREVRILSWGNDGILIFDKIFADQEFYCPEQYFSPLHIVNDIWTKNSITLVSGSLKETISGQNSDGKVIDCPAFWASINDIILYQCIWSKNKGLTYIPGNQKNSPKYWKNCRLDTLAVHMDDEVRKPGDTVYEIGFYIGSGKRPRPFKTTGISKDYFKGIIIMDGKFTDNLD